MIVFPTANAAWAYDLTEGFWHQRGWWDVATSNNDRPRAMFHTFVFGQHLVGDWSATGGKAGNIYTASLDTYSDAGDWIKRVRAARIPVSKGWDWSFLHAFRLIAENSTSPAQIAPSLAYSDDGGKTFITVGTAAAPFVSGEYGFWDWRRLGRFRDRVLQLTIFGADKVALTGASVDVE